MPQLFWVCPTKGNVFPQGKVSPGNMAPERVQFDRERIHSTEHLVEQFPHTDVPAEFFFDFPPQGTLEGFPRFDLASREFPVKLECLPRRSLHKEKLFMALNDGCGDPDGPLDLHWQLDSGFADTLHDPVFYIQASSLWHKG